MSMRIKIGALLMFLQIILGSFNLFAVQELSIGQSENIYLNPSLPSGGWITSTSWTTDVVGLECSYSGEWGTMVTAYGYWDDLATVSCLYTYSYYGADNKIHVSHGNAYYYFTCKGYPISLSQTSIILDAGKTATLEFSISGASIGQIAPRWESSHTAVATVYSSGTYSAIVNAREPGSCVITCYSYMGKPVTCTVKVNPVQPTSISIDPTEVTVTVGKTVSLKSCFSPSYASSSVTWSSMNSSIATVSSAGTVKGVKAGTTIITATTANSLTAQCAVTVTDKYVNPRGPVSNSLDGAGTSTNPYKIKSAADLRYLADKANSGTDFSGKYFLLMSDIVINPHAYDTEEFKSGEVWIPIGDIGKPFNGIFDGGNHLISGVFISNELELPEFDSRTVYGLFGSIGNSAKISNLKLTNSLYEIHKKVLVGGIVGSAGNNFNVVGCHVFNSLFHTTDVCATAGIISCTDTYGGRVDRCSNAANIYCEGVGIQSAGILSNYNERLTESEHHVVTNCINLGNIEAEDGTLAGISNGSWVLNCCNSGIISGKQSNLKISGIFSCFSPYKNRSIEIRNCIDYGYIKCPSEYISAICTYNSPYNATVKLQNNFYENDLDLFNVKLAKKNSSQRPK